MKSKEFAAAVKGGSEESKMNNLNKIRYEKDVVYSPFRSRCDYGGSSR